MVVRQIFAWCLAGVPTRAIATRLTDQKIPTRAGGQEWRAPRVREALRYVAYTGRMPTKKRETVSREPIETPTGTKIRERRRRVDRADWVWLDVPAIITRPTFDAAQAQLQ
jgi:hypothetical protein